MGLSQGVFYLEIVCVWVGVLVRQGLLHPQLALNTKSGKDLDRLILLRVGIVGVCDLCDIH